MRKLHAPKPEVSMKNRSGAKLARDCNANDQILVSEGYQCSNCLGLNGKHKPQSGGRTIGEHTPTPWRFDNGWVLGADNVCVFEEKDITAQTHNTEFVVRAVNTYDTLSARVRSLENSHDDLLQIVIDTHDKCVSGKGWGDCKCPIATAIRAAKAEESPSAHRSDKSSGGK